jgi:hypothetical protein
MQRPDPTENCTWNTLHRLKKLRNLQPCCSCHAALQIPRQHRLRRCILFTAPPKYSVIPSVLPAGLNVQALSASSGAGSCEHCERVAAPEACRRPPLAALLRYGGKVYLAQGLLENFDMPICPLLPDMMGRKIEGACVCRVRQRAPWPAHRQLVVRNGTALCRRSRTPLRRPAPQPQPARKQPAQ